MLSKIAAYLKKKKTKKKTGEGIFEELSALRTAGPDGMHNRILKRTSL